MDNAILKAELQKFIDSNYKPQILVVTKKASRNPSKKYFLYEFKADSDFLNPLYEDYKETLKIILDGKVINNFELDHSEDDSIEEIESSEVTEYNEINKILNSKATDMCNSKDFRIKDLSFIVIKFFVGNKILTIFSKYKSGKSLLKSHKAFIGGEKLEKFDKELLYFTDSIDAFELNGKIYIANRNNFMNMFSLRDAYFQVIEEHKEAILKFDLFDKSNEFIDLCQKNGNYIRKFCKIIITEGFQSLQENLDNVQKVIDEYELQIKLDSNRKIIFAGQESIPEILNLLSKHYVKSALNDEKLIAKALEQYKRKGSEAGEAS